MEFSTRIATIDLDGSPSEFGEPGGHWEKWRERFRDQSKKSFAGLRLPIAHPVRLVCYFRVLSSAKAHDLDNLLKPLIDALGAAGLFPRTRTGGKLSEWNTEDGWVYSVEADKELVESNAGTHVEIYVSREVADVVKMG
jgi:hypothetical protein